MRPTTEPEKEKTIDLEHVYLVKNDFGRTRYRGDARMDELERQSDFQFDIERIQQFRARHLRSVLLQTYLKQRKNNAF